MSKTQGKGQAMAELALCLPFLMLMIFALCQIAMIGQAAFLARSAAKSAARAYGVYCQQGPGYALDMATKAALAVTLRCMPRPRIALALLEEESRDSPDITLRLDMDYPLLFPGLAKVFGASDGTLTLSATASLFNEATPSFFKAHPEIKKK